MIDDVEHLFIGVFAICFELTFVKDVRTMSTFIVLYVDVQLFQHHLLKRLFLLHYIAFALLSKINWLYLWGTIYGISILFHWFISLFFCQFHTVLITVALH